jgi:hypothetical protein
MNDDNDNVTPFQKRKRKTPPEYGRLIPPASNDPRDLLMGRIIDQLYHLQNRVAWQERISLVLFIALVLVSLGDVLRLIDRWLK